MHNHQPHEAAQTRTAKRRLSVWSRPKAENHPRPNFDPVAYAAALEVLG